MKSCCHFAPTIKSCRASHICKAYLDTVKVGKSSNIRYHESTVSRTSKEDLLGQKGCTIWFTGLSASGKSTTACALEYLLHERGHFTVLLDGDNVRHGLNSNLGFSAEDRAENIRRIGEVAKLTSESGIITITSFISPYRADRDAVRQRVPSGEFLEIFMDVPMEICEARDPKGLYKKARAGLIKNFTGIDDPYEPPLTPEVTVQPYNKDGCMRDPYDMAHQILSYLDENGYLMDPRLRTIAASAATTVRHGLADMSAML